MVRLIAFLTPRRWWDWPLGIGFWGIVASVIAYLVEFVIDGRADDAFAKHMLTTTLIAAPLIVMGMFMFRHLDRLQRELTILATTDSLTAIANRRDFLKRANAAGSGILLMLDLDHFKAINDQHGHAIGDEVLRLTADLLRHSVREADIVGRLGGEEFGIFLAGANVKEATKIGDRLAAGLTYNQFDISFRVTASIGAVEVAVGGDVPSLLSLADKALYAAKRAGRARFALYQPSAARSDPAQVVV